MDRYSTPEMSRVFSDRNRMHTWCRIELAVIDAQAAYGIMEVATGDPITELPDLESMAEHEAETRHEVTGFLAAWRDQIGDDANKLHRGLTSSDLTDTGLALMVNQANALIQSAGYRAISGWARLALDHEHTVVLAKTHGQAAARTILGNRLAALVYQLEWAMKIEDLPGKMNGPVGLGNDQLPERVVWMIGANLGLDFAPVTSQAVPRVHLAAWASQMALIASAVEAIALEIRLMAQGSVGEAQEGFSSKQTGSSSMPHKRNPIESERACGLARVVRSNATPIIEGMALWDERDISHSSVERMLVPQIAQTVYFLLSWLAGQADTIEFNADAMDRNLAQAGSVVHTADTLNSLVQAGMDREVAYRGLQSGTIDPIPWPPPTMSDTARAYLLRTASL